ncbi:hypothetical protein BGY98DRAFT_936028 [Russula aff. rugulosa BPL654]|nr:hypothetical protein BGY98DRAFT_936028 [Russula aff. rugulosa BPL654]
MARRGDGTVHITEMDHWLLIEGPQINRKGHNDARRNDFWIHRILVPGRNNCHYHHQTFTLANRAMSMVRERLAQQTAGLMDVESHNDEDAASARNSRHPSSGDPEKRDKGKQRANDRWLILN